MTDEHSHMVGLIAQLDVTRQELSGLRAREKKLADQLKGYMEEHQLPELWDGEHEVGVELRARGGPAQWDVRSIPDELLQWARDNGLLTVHTSLYRDMKARAGAIELHDMQRYEMRTEQIALHVTRERKP